MSDSYKVIGIMSGTSLDGIDLAYVEFIFDGQAWSFTLKEAETNTYTLSWQKKLKNLMYSKAEEYVITDVLLGRLIAGQVNRFILKHRLSPDFIASHGHTIFHQPEKKCTSQIGNGASIAAITGLSTICDFRSADLAKGGQGAPLVPIGDRLLFGNYDFCLNLGGIANISFEYKGKRVAFDICPVNMAFNYLAGKSGKKYDRDGKMAALGKVNKALLQSLNGLSFYKKSFPKSLGAEWFLHSFKPLLDKSGVKIEDIHATVAEHICIQLKSVLRKAGADESKKMLITGGGTLHKFLIQKMKAQLPVGMVIPDRHLINYKEALIFAFLGVLRWRKEINTLASVTGAKKDSSSGAIYLP